MENRAVNNVGRTVNHPWQYWKGDDSITRTACREAPWVDGQWKAEGMGQLQLIRIHRSTQAFICTLQIIAVPFCSCSPGSQATSDATG
jgi:hypothetical protein